MKKSIAIKGFMFYVWVGIAYLSLWLIIDLSNEPDTFLPRVFNNIWLAGYLVIINFIFFEHSFPFLRRKRKNILITILLSISALIALIMLYSLGLFAWRFIGIQLLIYTSLKNFQSIEEGVFYIFPHGLLSVFFFGIIKQLYDHIKLRQAAQQLRIEKQEAELNYLRSQTNPHFLFNTLNNIYSLARDKNELAPESILRLSKILRFMLYETSSGYIAIEQELKIISDYIALEKLRYDDSLRVNFNYAIEDMKEALPPLLLIPLVENAFKHGVSETRHQPYVDIHLTVNERQLTYVVKNSVEFFSGEKSVKENIGLSNLRRQLELLYTEFDLSILQGEIEFTATLKINLASHV
jgi:two-component system, LytTR family, sensor kinase